ncbi:hypothetical protein BC830DRAFT_1078769 [Chytriomyces sp. MP71]|nr:hypothetical protein BC830DRAFT_1078769 [Chytriomyces sp. MP71]
MNQTNTISDPWAPYWVEINIGGENLFWVTVVMSLFQFTIMGYLLRREYMYKIATSDSRIVTWKAVFFNPVNLRIYSLTFVNLISAIFGQFLVLEFSWVRAYPIVQKSHKSSAQLLRLALIVYGLLQLAQIAIAFPSNLAPPSSPLYENFTALTADFSLASQIVAFGFEFFLLALFVRYLRAGRQEETLMDTDRLSVVARYGIASFWTIQISMKWSIFTARETAKKRIMSSLAAIENSKETSRGPSNGGYLSNPRSKTGAQFSSPK